MTGVSDVQMERDHSWIVFWWQVEHDIMTAGKSSYDLQTE